MKKTTALAACLMSVLMLASCSSPKPATTANPSATASIEPTGNSGIIKNDDDALKPDTSDPSSTPEIYEADTIYVLKDNLRTMDETVEYQGIEYTVNSVEFTKKLGERDQSLINYFDEERDEDGNLTGAQSYIFINLTIKNVSEERREELVNKDFVRITEDLILLETGAEARYNDNPQPGSTAFDAHHFFLEPGESATFEEIYIIDDEYLTDELCFLVGAAGSDGDNARNRFINVGSEIGD